jgi:type IV pilus assembly protein PilF
MLRFTLSQRIITNIGEPVARKLLTLIILGIVPLTLSACFRNDTGSWQVTYPYLQDARSNAGLALDYMQLGRTDMAVEKINLALQQAPTDPIVLEAAGYFQEKSGDIGLANRYFLKALTIAPTSGTIRNNYGAFLCRNGYSRTSIEYFLQAAHTPDPQVEAEAYANARYCARGLGAKGDSAYYTRLLAQPITSSIDTNKRAMT